MTGGIMLENPNSLIVHEFDKNKAEKVRFSLLSYRGRKYLDIRIFFDNSEERTPEWRPGRKGICLSIELLDDLRNGMEKAAEKIGTCNRLASKG
jgi:hypothetical protein